MIERSDASPSPVHDLLLGLAGRLDDDLLAWSRELLAVGEAGQAVELVGAALVAERVTLPPPLRAAVVAAARATQADLDVDATLPDAAAEDGTPHRFAPDRAPDDAVHRALAALPARRLAGCTLHLTWRATPAGAAPGPVPHPVVLVEAQPDRSVDVLAYLLATELDRAGVAAAVEVFPVGAPLPAYHAAALAAARPVRRDDGAADGPPVHEARHDADEGAGSLFAPSPAAEHVPAPPMEAPRPATGRRRRVDPAVSAPVPVDDPAPDTDPFLRPIDTPLLAPLLEPRGLADPPDRDAAADPAPSASDADTVDVPAEWERDWRSGEWAMPRSPSAPGPTGTDGGAPTAWSGDSGPAPWDAPSTGGFPAPAPWDQRSPNDATGGFPAPALRDGRPPNPPTGGFPAREPAPWGKPSPTGSTGGFPAREPAPWDPPSSSNPADLPTREPAPWDPPSPNGSTGGFPAREPAPWDPPSPNGATGGLPAREPRSGFTVGPQVNGPPSGALPPGFTWNNPMAAGPPPGAGGPPATGSFGVVDPTRTPAHAEPALPRRPARGGRGERDAPGRDRATARPPLDAPGDGDDGVSLFESPTGRVEAPRSVPRPPPEDGEQARSAAPFPSPEPVRPAEPFASAEPVQSAEPARSAEPFPSTAASFQDDPLFAPDVPLFDDPPTDGAPHRPGPMSPGRPTEQEGDQLPRRARRQRSDGPPSRPFPSTPFAPAPPDGSGTPDRAPRSADAPAGPEHGGERPDGNGRDPVGFDGAAQGTTERDLLAQLQAELAARERRPRPYRRAGPNGRAVNGRPGPDGGPPDLAG